MEDLNHDYSLERLSNPNTQLTLQDYKNFGDQAERMVNQIAGVINNVSGSVVRIHEVTAQVKLECARMEHVLDTLMVKAQKDISIYEKSLPILEKQFDKCQERMDKLMDKSMDLITNDLSAESLNRQEAMMSLIEVANDSLNSLIAKLIPGY